MQCVGRLDCSMTSTARHFHIRIRRRFWRADYGGGACSADISDGEPSHSVRLILTCDRPSRARAVVPHKWRCRDIDMIASLTAYEYFAPHLKPGRPSMWFDSFVTDEVTMKCRQEIIMKRMIAANHEPPARFAKVIHAGIRMRAPMPQRMI